MIGINFEICLWEIKERENIMMGRQERRGRQERQARRASGCWGNGEGEKRILDEIRKYSSDLIEFGGSFS